MSSIRLERTETSHARLFLSRSERNNALDLDALRELAHATAALCADPPKVLSILAEGGNFGVGGDIESFSKSLEQDRLDDWLQEAIGYYNRAITDLYGLKSAIVVGVQGAAAGGTLGLVWVADHVLVTENMKLNLAYANLGGSPDGGTSWLLPRLVNPLRAFELFTLCPSLNATQALAWGLANHIVPTADLHSSVEQVAQRWLKVPSISLRNFKCLLREAPTRTLEEHTRYELEGFRAAGTQPEFATLVENFMSTNRSRSMSK